MTDRKAVIKNADMSEEMQQDAVDCAMQAMDKYNIEKDIAAFVKKEFDKKYNPTWHCIVGRNFGSYVTHETKHFIYFYLGQVAILLFKSGWNPNMPSQNYLKFSPQYFCAMLYIGYHLSADMPTSWFPACVSLLLFATYNTTTIAEWRFSHAWTGDVPFVENANFKLLSIPALSQHFHIWQTHHDA